MSATAFVLILAAFLVAAGLVALIAGRAIRDGTAGMDDAAWIIVVAIGFSAVSLLLLELLLPRLEAVLL